MKEQLSEIHRNLCLHGRAECGGYVLTKEGSEYVITHPRGREMWRETSRNAAAKQLLHYGLAK